MKGKRVCFTGHRALAEMQTGKIFCRLIEVIRDLAEEGYTVFLCGGALGFDTLAAEAVIEAKAADPRIELILVLPFPSHTGSWEESDRRRYDRTAEYADEIIYVSEHYTPWCMHKRNRYIVDMSEVCVAYLTESSGGTYYTAEYARSRGLRVINTARDIGE